MSAREVVRRDTPGARNLRLTVEYDGAGFHGWQAQPGLRTVQGALEEALGTVCGHPVVARGAGRTDAGVHAWAQVASVLTTCGHAGRRIARGVTALAGPGVAVREVVDAPLDWDPRGDARGKRYVYRVLAREARSPLLEGRAWHLRGPVDIERLVAELATLPGERDWSSFRAADCGAPSPIKTLYRAEVRPEAHGVLALVFEGSGFLKQMVRILVGSAVAVGQGRRPPGFLLRAVEARDRRRAGPTAPPEGLYLERVFYAEPGADS